MTKPGSLNSRLAKWVILLSQYDMLFVPQKAVKGQALANFLSAHPVLESSKRHEDIPDEIFESNMISEDEVWQMFFDGALRIDPKDKIIAGVGVVFISPQNHVLSRAFSLTEPCSNNLAEYNALLVGLQLAHKMRICYLEAYGKSKLIINMLKENTRFAMEIWYPITMQSLKRLIYLKAFTSATCPNPKIPRQML